jgi:hypothetical protein
VGFPSFCFDNEQDAQNAAKFFPDAPPPQAAVIANIEVREVIAEA